MLSSCLVWIKMCRKHVIEDMWYGQRHIMGVACHYQRPSWMRSKEKGWLYVVQLYPTLNSTLRTQPDFNLVDLLQSELCSFNQPTFNSFNSTVSLSNPTLPTLTHIPNPVHPIQYFPISPRTTSLCNTREVHLGDEPSPGHINSQHITRKKGYF